MSKILKRLAEATDLNLFKRILSAFSCFVERQPGTGMSKIYKAMLDANVKMMPKDQRALDILDYLCKNKSDSAIVQDIMNCSFTELPCTVRPVYKNGSSKVVAFWCCDGKIYGKASDLLSINGDSGSRYWSDERGNKVELIDLTMEVS